MAIFVRPMNPPPFHLIPSYLSLYLEPLFLGPSRRFLHDAYFSPFGCEPAQGYVYVTVDASGPVGRGHCLRLYVSMFKMIGNVGGGFFKKRNLSADWTAVQRKRDVQYKWRGEMLRNHRICNKLLRYYDSLAWRSHWFILKYKSLISDGKKWPPMHPRTSRNCRAQGTPN